MENTLRKSGLYGLILGLALAILFVNYKEVTQISHGGYATTYKPVMDYIISILRYGIIGMFAGLFVGWKLVERKNKKQQAKSYYIPFFFAVFIIAVISQVILHW